MGISGNTELSWMLFNGFKVRINKARLEQLQAQSEVGVRLAVENTMQGIIAAYWQAVMERESLVVQAEVLRLSRDRYEFELLKRELGTGSTFEVLQPQNNYLADSLNQEGQQLTYQNALRNMRLAMGVLPDVAYVPLEELTYDEAKYELNDLEADMLSDNENLKNQYVNLELQKRATELAKSDFMPSVSVRTGVNGGVGRFQLHKSGAEGGSVSKSFDYYLNFTLSHTLFDAGNRRRAHENAQMREVIAQMNIDQLELSLKQQLRNTLETYNRQLENIKLNEKLMQTTDQSLRLAEERYKSGLISSFNYRDLQLAYVQASQRRLAAIYNLKLTETELIRLIGGLTESK